MRYLYFIIGLIMYSGLHAQNKDSIGTDNFPYLNKHELKLMHKLLNENGANANLLGKKLTFITGSSGKRIISKSDFFKNSVLPYTETDYQLQISILQLNEEEKLTSGGYDFLVLSWVKIFTVSRRKKIIKQLSQKSPE